MTVRARYGVSIAVALVFAAVLARVFIARPKPAAPPAYALEVTLIGHQYWWEIRYPQLGVVTANELHLPVSSTGHPIQVKVTLTSADAEHSIDIPGLDWKADVNANELDTATLTPQTVGRFAGQCAKDCGSPNGRMLLQVYVETTADFRAWAAHQREPATDDTSAAAGKKIFDHTVCMSCHSIAGTVAKGAFGPDLTHVASRATIAGGTLPNTPANVHAFIDNPPAMKPGCLMPSMHLDAHDLDAVAKYIASLK